MLNQYQYNFLPLELQTRMKSLGARKSVPVFAHPDAPSQNGVSTFVNYRYTRRGTEDWTPRTDGTYAKGVAQTATAWTGPDVSNPLRRASNAQERVRHAHARTLARAYLRTHLTTFCAPLTVGRREEDRAAARARGGGGRCALNWVSA